MGLTAFWSPLAPGEDEDNTISVELKTTESDLANDVANESNSTTVEEIADDLKIHEAVF